MIVNAVMPMWATAKMEGLLVPDRYLHTDQPPEAEGAFLMIQGLNETLASPWNYTFSYMTPKQILRSEVYARPFYLLHSTHEYPIQGL